MGKESGVLGEGGPCTEWGEEVLVGFSEEACWVCSAWVAGDGAGGGQVVSGGQAWKESLLAIEGRRAAHGG